MSEFLGVSSEFMPVIVWSMAITLFCYVLYMIFYRMCSGERKRKLLKLGEYPRQYVIPFALVSLFISILIRAPASSSLLHNLSTCALCVSIVFIVADSIAFVNGFYIEWFDYKE